MSRGRRYETEEKLNYQKVFAVAIAIIVIVMFIFIIKNVLVEREERNKEYEYFALYSADKWGVINQEGETVIQPSYQEMIVVPDRTKDVFICTYNINEETEEYSSKALNSKNEEIFTNYEQIEAIENIDKNYNIWYEENILKVKKNNKYGLIDLKGRELLACEYDEIKSLEGIENSIIIIKDNKQGIINSKGSIIVEPIYTKVLNLGETYKDGYITIDEQGKQGLISTTKKQLLGNQYEEIQQIYLGNYYLIKEAGKLKLINSSGEILLEEGFDDIKSVTTKGVIFTKGNLYGEMSITGETIIEPKYQDLKEVEEGIYIAKQNDRYGIIDKEENEKISFEYTNITYNEKAKLFIADDVEYNTSIIDKNYDIKATGILSKLDEEKEYIRIRIDDEYKYYNFEGKEKSNTEVLTENTLYLSKKDGRYGYIDKKGNIVIDYIYDEATEQNKYGFVAVKKNGLWGAINEDGEIIIEPKYDLENNLEIDFIGKWHLGQDLNMNYYCEK